MASEHHARHVVATLTHEAEADRWPRRLASANIDLVLTLLLTDRLDEACAVAQASMLSGRLVASDHWRALEVVRTVEARDLPEAADLWEAYELVRRGDSKLRRVGEIAYLGQNQAGNESLPRVRCPYRRLS
ncbi:MAG: hypothetical protein ACRDTJ_12750, partial [Pseudonocardiaceae bacterium]